MRVALVGAGGMAASYRKVFIENVPAGRALFMSGRAGRQDLAVVMAAYASAGKHAFMPVDILREKTDH